MKLNMKKQIIFIIIVFSTIVGLGQSYYVSVNNTIDYENTSYYCNNSRDAAVVSTQGYLRLEDIDGDILVSNSDGDFVFNSRPAIFIEDTGSCRYIEGPNRGYTFSLRSYQFIIPTDQNYYYETEEFADADTSAIYFEVNNHSIQELSCSSNTISAPSVVPTTAIMEWEYRLGSTVGIVNDSQNSRNINISLDTFQVDLSAYIGQSIDFRFKMINDVQSPWKAYTIVSCSPQLKDPNPEPILTTCSYDDNGGFKIKLERDIVDERLVVSLYEEDEPNVFSFRMQQNTTNSLEYDSVEDAYIFEWDTSKDIDGNGAPLLPNVNYQVRYQTLAIDDDIPGGGDDTWLSAETTNPFSIPQTTALVFSALVDGDETCFQENNGSINVSVTTREGDRELFYQLTKDEQVQVFNGTSWVDALPNENTWYSFGDVSAMTTTIGNLGKGSYRVKVKDIEDCFYRKVN